MITNFGSCCIDHVYAVPHFVKPGETLPCTAYDVHPGGKGLNQSLALANGGAEVRHAGKIGKDGEFLKRLLTDNGINTSLLQVIDEPSGHANIQVTPKGENCIVLFGGANRKITIADIETVLTHCEPGEALLIQNEISFLPELMRMADAAGQFIVFNAAPITAEVANYPLETVSMFIVNEVEGEGLTGETEPTAILSKMERLFPRAVIVLTLGKAGAWCSAGETRHYQAATPVNAADTTAAGDTFTGFFLSAWVDGVAPKACLKRACRAAGIAVTRAGAATSIPLMLEVDG